MRLHITIAALLLAVAADARQVVYRDQGGLKIVEAEIFLVNGKDSVRNAGAPESRAVSAAKLPSLKLAQSGLIVWSNAAQALVTLEPAGKVSALYPELQSKKDALDLAAAWKAASITYRSRKSDKQGTTLNPVQFIALLPSAPNALADFCQDRDLAALVAGKDAAFDFQVEILKAAVANPAVSASVQAVGAEVARVMRDSLAGYDSAAGDVRSLTRGLEYVRLSERVYTEDKDQKRLREDLLSRKRDFDRQLSILKALLAGEQWDAFLTAYTGFERHQWEYPELMEARKKALVASIAQHRTAGAARMKEREYKYALAEYSGAARLNPRDAVLQRDLAAAWTEYSFANARSEQGNVKQLTNSQREAIAQSIQMAEHYRQSRELDAALAKIKEAEENDPNSIPVLLKKAEVLGARNELSKALQTLDRADMAAVDEDRDRTRKLRTELLFQFDRIRTDTKAQVEKLIANFEYHKARKVALEAIRADEQDAEFLFYAGVTALVTRQYREGQDYLKRFLAAPVTVDTDPERRRAVYRLLDAVAGRKTNLDEAARGSRNWLSGLRLPPDVYYCPVSLAFQPKAARVDSKKMAVHLTWSGDFLKTIQQTWEKDAAPQGEKPFYFAYDTAAPQIRIVDTREIEEEKKKSEAPRQGALGMLGRTQAAERKTEIDPDEAIRGANVLLLNNPYIDPSMVELTTGQRIAVGIAGNRFFHPFAWQRPYFFQFSYDTQGRVASAKQLPDQASQQPQPLVTLDFEWDGLRLQRIRGYQSGSDPKDRRALIYERHLEYKGGKLTAEQIRSQGKDYTIQYKYEGEALLSAECADDPSIDGRSRQVTFQR